MLDFQPATTRLAGLLANISDEQLSAPTPCEHYTLGDLLDHVNGLSVAFTWAATKAPESRGNAGPTGDASRLPDDWRTRIPEQLAELARAWTEPSAWEGMTRVGGVDLPAPAAAGFGLNEVVVHGWDISRATGQPYDANPGAVAACLALVSQDGVREGIFGPIVPVEDEASALDRLVALTGRDPAWNGR
ncbi:MAG TPA: TIGR03086 family metal-binding protein [Jatrophihabitantaceae bacterium]|jgi:uncharacterized protein (TIGR03086 family)